MITDPLTIAISGIRYAVMAAMYHKFPEHLADLPDDEGVPLVFIGKSAGVDADLSSTIAMKLAKLLKRSPAQIAALILGSLSEVTTDDGVDIFIPFVESVTANKCYLNFKLNRGEFAYAMLRSTQEVSAHHGD